MFVRECQRKLARASLSVVASLLRVHVRELNAKKIVNNAASTQ